MQVDLAATSYAAGATTTALAAEHGVSRTALTAALRAAGVTIRERGGGRAWTADERRRVADGYAAGRTTRALAAELGPSPQTVIRVLDAACIARRPSGPRRGPAADPLSGRPGWSGCTPRAWATARQPRRPASPPRRRTSTCNAAA